MKNFPKKINTLKKEPKIFCIGLFKTATTTLDTVFSELGYYSIHNPNIYKHSSLKIRLILFINRFFCSLSLFFFNKQRSFLKKTYGSNNKLKLDMSNYKKYQVFSDLPIAYFYKELDTMFPNSKFILTVRKKESWLKSCQNFFPMQKKNKFFMDGWGKYQQIHFNFFGSPFFDSEKFSTKYDSHVEDVNDYFKNRDNDLLVLNIIDGDGYEKLCPFLGIETIQMDFPKKNEFKKRFK